MSSDNDAGAGGFATEAPRYSPVSVVVAIIGVMIAAFILSWVYGPAEHYSPIIYLNLALTAGYGWLIGKVGCTLIRKKRINGRVAAFLIGGIGGLFAIWFAWLTYVWVITDFNFKAYGECLTKPALLWELITYIAENPVWALSTKSGRSGSEPAIFYYAVWVVELVGLVGLPAFLCLDFLKSNRLCAACGDWIKETGDVAVFALPEGTNAVDALKEGNIAVLSTLPRPQEGDEATRWLEAKGHACPHCREEDSFVTVRLVEMVLNKKSKKLERTEKILALHVKVDVDLEKKIFEPAEAPVAAPEEPALSGN